MKKKEPKKPDLDELIEKYNGLDSVSYLAKDLARQRRNKNLQLAAKVFKIILIGTFTFLAVRGAMSFYQAYDLAQLARAQGIDIKETMMCKNIKGDANCDNNKIYLASAREREAARYCRR